MRVATLWATAGVAPDGDACAEAQRSDLRPNCDDLADGFVARLTEQVGIIERCTWKHGLAAEDMKVPVRTGGDSANADKNFSGTGLGHRDFTPLCAAG